MRPLEKRAGQRPSPGYPSTIPHLACQTVHGSSVVTQVHIIVYFAEIMPLVVNRTSLRRVLQNASLAWRLASMRQLNAETAVSKFVNRSFFGNCG